MDSQHRHELKENDLEQFLLHLRQWWSKNGRKTLVAILIVALVITVWRVRTGAAAAQRNTNWENLAISTTPQTSLAVVDTSHTAGLRNLSRLRSGDMWLEKSGEPVDSPAPGADATDVTEELDTPENMSVEQMLEEAQITYQQVLDDPEAKNPFKLSALLGLASIAEAMGRWEQAAGFYDQVVAEATDAYPGHSTQARLRKANLKQLQQPIFFAPDDSPVEASTQVQPPTDMPAEDEYDTTAFPDSP